MIHLSNCPICNSPDTKPFLTCTDYTVSKQIFSIVSCEICGFKFTNPRPTENKLGDYYKVENYISHTDTNKGLISKLYKFVRNYTLGKKVNLVNLYARKGNLLDYGCGTGMFLVEAKRSSWNVFGIEPDAGARNLASRNSGAEVHESLFAANKFLSDTRFRCITLWHVLEHVSSLNETMNWFHTFLEENGVLIIAVPNYKSFDAKLYGNFWAAYDVPRHLSHFDKESILRLATNNGFNHVKSLPMKFDSFYVSMLSERYKSGRINYLKAFVTGLRSNMKARSATEYSSVIYVFRKA